MDFLERLKTEKEELALKIEKLTNFIASDKFNELNLMQKNLLQLQAGAMETYHDCLLFRINDLN